MIVLICERYASMVEIEIDSHNRLNIPKSVLDQYKISSDVSVGVGDHFEIWNQQAFEKYRANTSQKLKWDC